MALPRTKDDLDIYRVETIPPPPGEDDAYGAPTKIGPMSKAAIDKMMADSEVDADGHPASGIRSAMRQSPAQPSSAPASAIRVPPPAALPAALPILADDDANDDAVASALEPTTVGRQEGIASAAPTRAAVDDLAELVRSCSSAEPATPPVDVPVTATENRAATPVAAPAASTPIPFVVDLSARRDRQASLLRSPVGLAMVVFAGACGIALAGLCASFF